MSHYDLMSLQVHYNVGKVLSDAGNWEKGEVHYKEAIRYSVNVEIFHFIITRWK